MKTTVVKNKVTKKVSLSKREKGCYSEKWSDGEYRIIDDLTILIYNIHRFKLNGKQIKATYNSITTPKVKDKLIIDGVLYSVKSVMLEITSNTHGEFKDGIDYHIELAKA